jgi:hypothetical protein
LYLLPLFFPRLSCSKSVDELEEFRRRARVLQLRIKRWGYRENEGENTKIPKLDRSVTNRWRERPGSLGSLRRDHAESLRWRLLRD